MTNPVPQKEHEWLQQLVGDWVFDGECSMGPDQPPMKNAGTDHTRSIGGLWTISEWTSPGPDNQTMTSIITLGYDPTRQRFVGTFITSVMTYQWLYDGQLDDSGKILTLNAEGPSMAAEGKMAKYQDIIEVVSHDHHILRSQLQGEEGQWTQFMTTHFRRKGA